MDQQKKRVSIIVAAPFLLWGPENAAGVFFLPVINRCGWTCDVLPLFGSGALMAGASDPRDRSADRAGIREVAQIMRVTVGPTLMSAMGILLLTLGTARTQGVVLPLPPEDQQKISAQLGTGVVGKPLPSEPIEDVSVYFPLRERAYTFRVMSGHSAGKSQTLGLVKARLLGGEAAWRFQLSPSLISFIAQTLHGDLTMPALIDVKEGVVIITTPANPFVPKGMKPGETRSYSQQVSVNYLDDPSDKEYSGSLSGTYTYVGTYQVTVPAGTFAAILLRVKCQGKVGPAHTQNTAYNFFAPGIGEVAMIMQEDVEAFWIYHINSTSGKVLMFPSRG